MLHYNKDEKMSTLLKVLYPAGEELEAPYLIRVSGWTEERYFQEVPENQIVEFEDGEVIMHSPASITHQLITKFLTFLVGGFVDSRKLGIVLNGPAVGNCGKVLITNRICFTWRKNSRAA
jgi:hypothetical protein